MAELVICRTDHHHPDPEKDRRGCYKRGDIGSVHEDGETAGKPWLTVLLLPGFPSQAASIKYLAEPRREPMTQRRQMSLQEFDDLQNDDYTANTHSFNGLLRQFGQDMRTKKPVKVSEIDADTFEVDDTVIGTHTRRLYQIPADEMDSLFSGSVTRATLTPAQWNTMVNSQIIDKREAM